MVAMVKPYRHPKTGIFWIRKVIPERLRPQFGGRREFKVTLRTREPQEAKLLASARLIEFERRLQVAAGVSLGTLPYIEGFKRIRASPRSIAGSIQHHLPIVETPSSDTLLDRLAIVVRTFRPVEVGLVLDGLHRIVSYVQNVVHFDEGTDPEMSAIRRKLRV